MTTTTATQETVVAANKKAAQPQATRKMVPTKATVQLSKRAVREGTSISLKQLKDKLGTKITNNLDTMETKFGITFKQAYLTEGTLDNPKHVIVVGKTDNGQTVNYDRFNAVVFVEGSKVRLTNLLQMNKKQFEKKFAMA